MLPDAMEDLEISLGIRKQLELRREAETDPNMDPALYTPWARMGLEDYQERQVKSDAAPKLPAENDADQFADEGHDE